MRLRTMASTVLLAFTIALATAMTIPVAKAMQVSETTVSEEGVRDVCGKQLQSNGGVIGCTKKCGNYTCDYSCGGPEGPGCRVFVFSRAFTQAQRDTLERHSTCSRSSCRRRRRRSRQLAERSEASTSGRR